MNFTHPETLIVWIDGRVSEIPLDLNLPPTAEVTIKPVAEAPKAKGRPYLRLVKP